MRHYRNAGPDQRSCKRQSRQLVACRERQRTASGNGQEHRFDPPRPVPIEQHARRYLHRRERQEVRAGQQAKRRRADAEVPQKVWRNDRVDRAIEVRQQVRDRKARVETEEIRWSHARVVGVWSIGLTCGWGLSPMCPLAAMRTPHGYGSDRASGIDTVITTPRPSARLSALTLPP